MEPLTAGALVATGLLGSGLCLAWFRQAGAREELFDVALAHRLRHVGGIAAGSVRGLQVEVGLRRGVLWVRVATPGVGLQLRREVVVDRLRGRDLQTGDRDFDQRVRVAGRASAAGRLSEAARAGWLALDDRVRGLTLSDDALTCDVPAGRLAEALSRGVELGLELLRPSSDVGGLVTRVRRDRSVAVRLRMLVRLAECDGRAAQAVARRQLHDGPPAVRVIAAALLERVDVLLRLVADEHLPIPARVAAAEVVARLGTDEHLPRLAKLERVKEDAVRAAVVVAGGAIRARQGGGDWEGALSLAELLGGELGEVEETSAAG